MPVTMASRCRMSESILPGAIHRETEFVRGLTGACGPNALAMGQAWAEQRTDVGTISVYAWMRARGLCDVSGASTLEDLRQADVDLGLPVVDDRDYGEPWADWRTWYLSLVGNAFILVESANGQAPRASISGLGENASNLSNQLTAIVVSHNADEMI